MASVLVVDDTSSIRQMVRQMLELAGHSVREAFNGADGLAQYREDPADLVLVDLFMPLKDGLETITDLKAEFPAVRVIAMTSHGEKEQYDFLRVASALGAEQVLRKPFSGDELKAAVGKVLEA